MDNILLSSALAFIITFFAIPVIIQVAKDKKLFDEPDERKVHKTVIPTLGGLGIFAGFIIASLLGVPAGTPELQYFAAAAIVVFFLGIKDDILILSASKKFIGQLIAAGILIKFGGVSINNMHGLMGVYEIPHVASVALSLFTIIVITNSFNLIDGVDGLAGSLGFLTTIVFGAYFFYIGEVAYAVLAFALAGSLISFLIYNFSPAKIFMGDTGSLLLGIVNSILVIRFINMAGSSTVSMPIEAAPAIGFSILMIPLFDTLRVFSLRIFDRRSPFSPDRNHIHHFLLDLGFSHKKITLTCVFANIIFIAMAFGLRSLGTTTVMGILLATAFSFIGIIYYLRQKSRSGRLQKTPETEVIKSHKILTLVSDTVEVD
ncbi:MAG: undecaprenyl/decaprenyl-phosphate alpha-N-acetylglucosaminyl 1-phosphate transferase [Bacteroidetes bacterium]|nr:undecaprenyl/decaprenyl-phosphate alpha-N-acetylglucosaminyl 1-phosphate transferase [Bacteroidota bacterium]